MTPFQTRASAAGGAKMTDPRAGSTFASFLEEQGVKAEVEAEASERVRQYAAQLLRAAGWTVMSPAENAAYESPAWEANRRLNALVEQLCQALERIRDGATPADAIAREALS